MLCSKLLIILHVNFSFKDKDICFQYTLCGRKLMLQSVNSSVAFMFVEGTEICIHLNTL
jgi:hypothetical protein